MWLILLIVLLNLKKIIKKQLICLNMKRLVTLLILIKNYCSGIDTIEQNVNFQQSRNVTDFLCLTLSHLG